MKRVGILAAALLLGLGSRSALAQTAKPRFVVILDNSGTMLYQTSSNTTTHGDGSDAQPGCDLDNNGLYDDSRMYKAKKAIIDTISAFGSAEFALAAYARTLLGQPCSTNADCPAASQAGTECATIPEIAPSTQKYCISRRPWDGMDPNKFKGYLECAPGSTCTRCANPSDTNDRIFEIRSPKPTGDEPGGNGCGTCSFSGGCIGGQVIVPFPTNGSNLNAIYSWIDGKEDHPPFTSTSNREIRAETFTPLASAVDSVAHWLEADDSSASQVGVLPGALRSGSANYDPKASCRPYSIILLTDGVESCGGDPAGAAQRAANDGIKVYVVGFSVVNSDQQNTLRNIASKGGTSNAYFPTDQSSLTAALGDIVLGSMVKPKCDCNETCDDERAAFPLKGTPCTVGKGRCKRQGVYSCNAAGDGVICATAATCPATPVTQGPPTTEVCGAATGCQAPTPEDCQDDDCDGEVDEGLSCTCANKPELCNGVDDNCNNQIDENIPTVPCGLNIGECHQGNLVCVNGSSVCQGATGPTVEVCDNKDNDCDGVIDGISEPCYPTGFTGCSYDSATGKWSCKGICQVGRRVCTAGAWGECVGATTPQTEIPCDALDNNCDGTVDENAPDPANPPKCYPSGVAGCDTSGANCVGECKPGQLICQNSVLACVGAKTPTAEMCNLKDDDCDTKIDEDFPLLGQECGGTGLCNQKGTYICNSLGTDVVCTASGAAGTAEVCDGIDNDCNGKIDDGDMPGVGVPCGSAVGECKPGITQCINGKIVCNDVGPQPEVCNGLDDNCNGSVDEGVVSPGACNPAGLSTGAPMQGECKPGEAYCDGKNGWQCKGGVGPVAEICDCRDNNCNGDVDEGDICGAGYACVDCECVPKCHQNDELVCPPDRYCDNTKGVCLLKACARKPCAAGQICNAAGNCIDPCAGVVCPVGATCMGGTCRDCYSLGCPAGQVCHERACIADPCANVACQVGQYCNNGQCVTSCSALACPDGQTCQQGTCVANPCGAECPIGTYCNLASLTCEYKRCSGVACTVGTVCIEQTGKCSASPCDVVRCAAGETCVVQSSGVADCQVPAGGQVPIVLKAKVGGMGSGIVRCQCNLGAANSGSAQGGLWLTLVALSGVAAHLARRRPRRGSRR